MTVSRESLFRSVVLLLLLLACAFTCSETRGADGASSDALPKRLKRSESFFGMHFDFHAGKDDQNIGATTNPETIQTIIDEVKPDYIQIDSKGHPGWTSYPTKVGNPAPGIAVDYLKIWREVTAKNGVALYTHYSGVWDGQAISSHPEWAAIDANGNPSDSRASVFGEYKNQLLVPQLLEMARDYGTDGVWVDGECWATILDYSDKAKEAFKQKTGRDKIPTSPDQDGWNEWFAFHQEGFRQYLRDYVNAVKSEVSDFQIASNWAFTDHMPEPVSANVDFISGDFSPDNSINASRYSARLMSNQGIAWDLMAWSFGSYNGQYGNWRQKPGFQLSREAACALSQGGGFQAYITQERDGSVNLEKLPGMIETSKFCRARQKLCQYSTSVPQLALYCPTAQHYKNTAMSGGPLFPMITWQRPILERLLELNYSVDVFLEKTLTEKIDSTKAIVFYRCGEWSDELKLKVAEFVQNGGSVLLIGNESVDELGGVLDKSEKSPLADKDETWFLDLYRYGSGKIVAFPTPVGSPQEFIDANGETFNDYLALAVRTVFPTPIVQFDNPLPIDVSIRRSQTGQLTVHLVNVSGPHEQAGILDSIEPIVNVKTTLNLDKKPQRIRLEPSGIDLAFKWEDGRAEFDIPSIPIYEIITIED